MRNASLTTIALTKAGGGDVKDCSIDLEIRFLRRPNGGDVKDCGTNLEIRFLHRCARLLQPQHRWHALLQLLDELRVHVLVIVGNIEHVDCTPSEQAIELRLQA